MFKKIALAIVLLIVLLAGFMIMKTLTFESKQKTYPQVERREISDQVVKNLSDAIRIKTISYDDSTKIDYSQFDTLHSLLKERFPLADSVLKKQKINKYSLLYTWEGTNRDLPPAVFTGHQDVVPVEDQDLAKWEQPPFEGKVVDNYIWGRGTLDDKGAVLGLLEAVTLLLKDGHSPERTIIFAFGHDEEVMGKHGAMKTVELLKQNKIEPEFVMDEGLVITKGLVPGIEKPVALIGTSEKGYLTLELKVNVDGGHSSMPQRETAIDILSMAIFSLRNTPFPSELSKAIDGFTKTVGPELPFGLKMAFANKWLLEQQIVDAYSATAPGQALMTTTIAPTVFKAGEKENAVPSMATAMINFRILPGTSIKQVIAHVKSAINDDRIKIKPVGGASEASPISSLTSLGYLTIEKSIRELAPNTIVSPNLMLATSDARHYTSLAKNVYRFLPVTLNNEDIAGIHGVNERIGVENYKQSIRFYVQILKNASKETL